MFTRALLSSRTTGLIAFPHCSEYTKLQNEIGVGRKLKRRKKMCRLEIQKFVDEHGVTPQQWMDQWSKDGFPDTMETAFISISARWVMSINQDSNRRTT